MRLQSSIGNFYGQNRAARRALAADRARQGRQDRRHLTALAATAAAVPVRPDAVARVALVAHLAGGGTPATFAIRTCTCKALAVAATLDRQRAEYVVVPFAGGDEWGRCSDGAGWGADHAPVVVVATGDPCDHVNCTKNHRLPTAEVAEFVDDVLGQMPAGREALLSPGWAGRFGEQAGATV